MRAALESLLRERKLDVTLLSTDPSVEAVDAPFGNGLRRGQLSEITGADSSGRSTLVAKALAAATARGEAVAYVDTHDTFDPASAAAHGVALPQLLWVRDPAGDVIRALKAFSLILQAGGFGLVVFDLACAAPIALRRLPPTTWMRIARIVEGSDTVALLAGADHIARSSGGMTIALESPAPAWQGATHRARLFAGVQSSPRVVGGRR